MILQRMTEVVICVVDVLMVKYAMLVSAVDSNTGSSGISDNLVR